MNWSPALGFTHIDENLARCVAPLSKANAQYCVSIQVERILNYSQQPLDPQVLAIFEEHGIRIVSYSETKFYYFILFYSFITARGEY